MKSNLSILEQNMLICAEGDEDAELVYLRGKDRNEWEAFKAMLERVRINRFFKALEPAIKEIYGHEINEYGALDFIRERHFNLRLPKKGSQK